MSNSDLNKFLSSLNTGTKTREFSLFKIFILVNFKFGVISFAEGKQSHKDFVLFGEGLINFDGISIRAAID